MTGQYKVISDNLGEYSVVTKDNVLVATEIQHRITAETFCEELNILAEENEELKDDLKRCRNWINSDKNDYELTLAFIKNKGYSLKDVLEYEKELKSE